MSLTAEFRLMKEDQEAYFRWALLAPYRNPDHLFGLHWMYKSPPPNLEGDNIEIEMKSGFKRRDLLESLLLKSNEFLSFDEIVDAVSASFPGGNREEFGVKRTMENFVCGTHLAGIYTTVVPYIAPLFKKTYHFENSTLEENDYYFFFDGKFLSNLTTSLNPLYAQRLHCNHGAGPLDKMLPKIRELHQELGRMDSKMIEENPALFCQKIAQVLSHTGKLTIFRRGTGRLVETWLGYVFLKKGFSRIPLLKKIQLDVLNIALPQEIEEKLLLYFFKLESLPKCIQQYITELNKQPEMDTLLQEFNLGPYQKLTISTKKPPILLSDEKIIDNFLNYSFIKSNSRDRSGENLLTWYVSQNQYNFARQIVASGKISSLRDLDSQGNSVCFKMLKMEVVSNLSDLSVRVSSAFGSLFQNSRVPPRPANSKVELSRQTSSINPEKN